MYLLCQFFLRKDKQKCKSVLGHWYGLFILCASNHKTRNLSVLGENVYCYHVLMQDEHYLIPTLLLIILWLCCRIIIKRSHHKLFSVHKFISVHQFDIECIFKDGCTELYEMQADSTYLLGLLMLLSHDMTLRCHNCFPLI